MDRADHRAAALRQLLEHVHHLQARRAVQSAAQHESSYIAMLTCTTRVRATRDEALTVTVRRRGSASASAALRAARTRIRH